MNPSRKGWITGSVLTIALGAAWLLNTLNVIPGVDWIWTSLLGVTGILVIVLGGVNKMTFVVGPFLLITSVFSVLRQTGRCETDVEVPTLVIILGVLMLGATILPIPSPHWLNENADDSTQRPGG
jgi:hypothetical protein